MGRLVGIIVFISVITLPLLARPPVIPKPEAKRLNEKVKMYPMSPTNSTQHAIASLITKSGRCTSFFVSGSAHALTASHCLESCMGPNVKLGRIPQRCEVLIEGVPKVIKIFSGNFKCTEAERIKLSEKPETPDPKACRQGPQGDLALIQVENPPSSMKCLALASDPVVEGSPVTGFGYPEETLRVYAGEVLGAKALPSAGNSDGVSRHFSLGSIIALGSPCVVTTSDGRPGTRVAFPPMAENRKAEFFQTQIDTIGGFSGGPIINTDSGEVVGIFSGLFQLDNFKAKKFECVGANINQRIDGLSNRLLQLNPQMDPNVLRSLSCRNPIKPIIKRPSPPMSGSKAR